MAEKLDRLKLAGCLDKSSFVPLQRQLSDRLRRAIIDAQLSPGQALPSARELARLLNVSRSTILRSYEDLASQGYIVSVPGLGSRVNPHLPGRGAAHELAPSSSPARSGRVVFSQYGQRLLQMSQVRTQEPGTATSGRRAADECHVPQLNYGGPAIDLAPLSEWKRTLERNCRFKDLTRLEYSREPFGYAPLRAAYAAYLARARAVRCSTDQVAVFSARELRLDLLCTILIEPGDCVVTEEPGWPSCRQRFASHGAVVVPVPVDLEGLQVDRLIALNQKVKFVYVLPSYSEPSGVALSLARRRQLLDWAEQSGTFIIEDDYASEYRYEGNPLPSLPSLQGIDSGDRVIYLSCPWKVLFPVVRLGFLVVPKRLVEGLSAAKALIENDLPLIDQFALTDFINEGHLERHIRKTRPIYGRRRQALVRSLQRHFGDRLSVSQQCTGFELMVRFDMDIPDDEMLRIASDNQIPLVSTRSYYTGPSRPGEFIMAFAQFDEESIEKMVARLKRAVLGASPDRPVLHS